MFNLLFITLRAFSGSCRYFHYFVGTSFSDATYFLAIACPDQGLLKNGEIVCNRDNFYDSQCKFECKNDQYIHHPPELTSNVCLLNGSWSQPKPCCISKIKMSLRDTKKGYWKRRIILHFILFLFFFEMSQKSVIGFLLFRKHLD